jgi:hypothetical protein
MNIEVICIDDSMRPNEVPLSRWVKRNQVYHIVEIARMSQQTGVLGCKLAEINNDDLFPYQYFRLSRFAKVEPEKTRQEVEKEELIET